MEPDQKRQRLENDVDGSSSRRHSSRVRAATVDYSMARRSRQSVQQTEDHQASGHLKSSSAASPSAKRAKSVAAVTEIQDPIEAKRQELNEIVDRYDDYVRLLFHLEKFVSLVYYDPVAVKSDTSNVFEEFSQRFDLWANSDVAAGAHGRRARHTRKQIRETQQVYEQEPQARRESLEPEPKPKAATVPRTAKAAKDVKPSKSKSNSSHHNAKRSGSVNAETVTPRPKAASTSSRPTKSGKTLPKSWQKKYEKGLNTDESESDPDDGLTFDDLFPHEQQGIVLDIPEPDDNLPEYSADEQVPELRLHVGSPPPPSITHPSHQVNKATFKGSLEQYFASFLSLDEEDVTNEEAEHYIEDQVALRKRIIDAKLRGIITEDGLTASEVNELQKFVDPFKSSPTHHDYLTAQAIYMARVQKENRKSAMSTSRKIATMVDQYFRRLAGAEERERKQTEKALRQLARRTAQEVMKKWKLVEKVVKQRELQRQAEEQRKLGRIQLKNMLEHSAQLLEARIETNRSLLQGELSDGDSRDSSEIASSVDASAAESEEDGTGGSESEDSDFMSSSSDDESDAGSAKADDDEDDKLTAEQLREKYAVLQNMTEDSDDQSEDESEETEQQPVELSPRAREIYEQEIKNNEDDSDESITMDSEEDSDSDDDSEASGSELESSANSPEPKSLGLASLFSQPLDFADDDADEEDKEVKIEDFASSEGEEEEELTDAMKTSESPTSTPENAVSEESQPTVQHVKPPFLLRGTLREYQQDGLDWLVNLYNNQTNGILADEMGLGKTIQTIALLAYLACEKEVWGPHLIVVPTSVILNWEMEFKRFAPGFKVLTYYGNPSQRKDKRRGWNKENTFHVCITSYQLVIQDQHAFKRKKWRYLILDEAHNIKNFRSQRWQALLNFNSERRLLLTGTPLQNNLIDLWSLLYFLMPSSARNGDNNAAMPEGFANLQDFQEWFARPVDKMVEEGGDTADEETKAAVMKLHQILRPYLLRRLKADVEKQMPGKYEHIIYCRLSKRQRYLYDDFMSRAQTKETLASGSFLSIISCLMQLRKVCNHPDLFEVRPIVTSLALQNSVASPFISDYQLFEGFTVNTDPSNQLNLSLLNLNMADHEEITSLSYETCQRYRGNRSLALEIAEVGLREGRPYDSNFDSLMAHNRYWTYEQSFSKADKMRHFLYLNMFKCAKKPLYGRDLRRAFDIVGRHKEGLGFDWDDLNSMKELKKTYFSREESMKDVLMLYSVITPKVVYLDEAELTLGKRVAHVVREDMDKQVTSWRWDQSLMHESQVRLSIAFPDKRLLQYDCGKLQRLATLLRDLVADGHRALIFTQMTRVLDVLEQFLNLHGYRYLRLDGATKIEQRQVLTERFNSDAKIPVFILSSRSGGLGINLTGADTVIFYDSDWNPSMDKQCQDRCHRIGQTRDVHIYRFVSEYTIESNILRKATQKQILDNVVIQEGEFTTDYFNKLTVRDMIGDIANAEVERDLDRTLFEGNEKSLEKTLAQAEDTEDAVAASVAIREENLDVEEFQEEGQQKTQQPDDSLDGSVTPQPEAGAVAKNTDKLSALNEDIVDTTVEGRQDSVISSANEEADAEREDGDQGEQEEDEGEEEEDEEEEDGIGNVDDYMIKFIEDGYYDVN